MLVAADEVPAAEAGAGLGAAIIWALRAGASELNLIAENGAAVMARRAGEFTLPIRVFESDGATVRAAVAAAPLPRVAPDPAHLALIPTIEAAGAEALVEHGVVTGEVRGLEVCRVVDGAAGRPRLDVGIGAHDREAFAMIHGAVPARRRPRRRGCDRRRAPRAGYAAAPAQPAGGRAAVAMAPAAGALARRDGLGATGRATGADDATSPTVCRAPRSARRSTASRTLLVCSVGVDLDVIPYAADARLALGEPGVGPGGMMRSAEPIVVRAGARRACAATRELAGALAHSVTFCSLD